MSFEPDFLDLFTYTVTYTPAAALNQYGVRSYSTASVTYPARIIERQDAVRQPNGQTVASKATIWVASTATSLQAEARWTLPAGILPTTQPAILAAEMYPDQDGPHHWKLSCGW